MTPIKLWQRNYFLFQAANSITAFCDFLASIALHWWVLKQSNDISNLSLIFLSANFVKLISLPLLGPIGDRFNRRNILNCSDILSSILSYIVAACIYYNHKSIFLLCFLTGALSLASSLFRAGSAGILAEIVPKDYYPRAVSHSQIIFTLSLILGGSIGALVVSIIGSFWTIFANATAIFVAFLLIKRIQLPPKETTSNKYSLIEWKNDFISGLRFIINEKKILASFFIAIIMNALLTPFDLILPYFIQKTNLGSIRDLGLIESFIGIGSICGSLLFTLKIVKNNTLHTVLGAVAIVSVSLFFYGMNKNLIVLCMLSAFFGLGQVLFFMPVRIKLMLALPFEMRSRIGTIFSFGQMAGKPLAVMATTTAMGLFSIPSILMCIAILIAIFVPIIMFTPSYYKFLTTDRLSSPGTVVQQSN